MVEIFENGDSSYSCGRAKMEVFKYDGLCHGYVIGLLFCTNDSKMLHVDTDFFKYRENNFIYFRKYPATCRWSSMNQKMLHADADIFKIWRGKSQFSKIPSYVWTRP